MPFDSETLYAPIQSQARLSLTALIDGVTAPDAAWAAARPERALAFLMVAPQDCAALDVL